MNITKTKTNTRSRTRNSEKLKGDTSRKLKKTSRQKDENFDIRNEIKNLKQFQSKDCDKKDRDKKLRDNSKKRRGKSTGRVRVNDLKKMIIHEIKNALFQNKNFHISELDALLTTKTLERKIRARVTTQSKYESVLKKILNFFERLAKMKCEHIPIFLKNFDFKTKIIAKLAGKSESSLKIVEEKLGLNKKQVTSNLSGGYGHSYTHNLKTETFDTVNTDLLECKIKKLKKEVILPGKID